MIKIKMTATSPMELLLLLETYELDLNFKFALNKDSKRLDNVIIELLRYLALLSLQ